MKSNRPKSVDEVFSVMKDYCQKKKYLFSDVQLRFLAENCFLYFESRGWANIKYWPAVAMKWCLNNLHKQSKQNYNKRSDKINKGKTVRQQILEEQNDG